MYVYYIFTDCILAGSFSFFWSLILNIKKYWASYHWRYIIVSSTHENVQNCGEAYKTISLSNSTVMRHTESLSEASQNNCRPKSALQIDAAGSPRPPCICQVLSQRKHSGEFMFCLPLSERCTGSEIFKAVNDNFTTEDISWVNLIWYFLCITGCKKHSANPVLPCTVELWGSASQEFF
jgi:hypothetical protein